MIGPPGPVTASPKHIAPPEPVEGSARRSYWSHSSHRTDKTNRTNGRIEGFCPRDNASTGGPARTARRQAIHPGWNSASSRSSTTLIRSKMYSIPLYRISTPQSRNTDVRSFSYSKVVATRNEAGFSAIASYQCASTAHAIQSVKAPETSSMIVAYCFRSSRRTPAMLKPRAKGGQSRMDDFTKVESRLPQVGCRMICSDTVTAKTAKIFAAIFP